RCHATGANVEPNQEDSRQESGPQPLQVHPRPPGGNFFSILRRGRGNLCSHALGSLWFVNVVPRQGSKLAIPQSAPNKYTRIFRVINGVRERSSVLVRQAGPAPSTYKPTRGLSREMGYSLGKGR